jgi:hypothetical protein
MPSASRQQDLTETRSAICRGLNDSIRAEHLRRGTLPSMLAWVCECGNEACLEALNLTVSEYTAVRAHPTRFVVAPGPEHVGSGFPQVAERHERYWVVDTGRCAIADSGNRDK